MPKFEGTKKRIQLGIEPQFLSHTVDYRYFFGFQPPVPANRRLAQRFLSHSRQTREYLRQPRPEALF